MGVSFLFFCGKVFVEELLFLLFHPFCVLITRKGYYVTSVMEPINSFGFVPIEIDNLLTHFLYVHILSNRFCCVAAVVLKGSILMAWEAALIKTCS